MRKALIASAALAGCAVPVSTPSQERAKLGGDSPLVSVFTRVAADTGVPADLLAAVSYTQTRWSFVQPAPDSHAFETGPMALTERDLHRAASLAGVSDEAARTDFEASLRAGAALLRADAIGNDFTSALGDELAYAVQTELAKGIDGRDEAGFRFIVPAQRAKSTPGFSSVSQAAGYPGAEWVPAYSGNYNIANRGVGDIKYIVVHNTEGSYTGTLSWFKDPAANVSAHYVLRSRDGHVSQMVDEKDIAWHDKCFNTNSVGIEHEGFIAKPEAWYTEAMYAESAKLAAYLADKYNIAKTHSTSSILGHNEAPDCSTNVDPGPGWNWAHYIDLVKTGGAASFKGEDIIVDAPDVIVSGETATVTVTINNTGTAAWDLDATRIGTTDPQDRESAFFSDGDWLSPSRATAVDTQTAAGSPGTFTFQIKGPDVSAPMVFDEAFSFVQEGVTWFGPTFHVVIQVKPALDDGDSSGCSAGRTASPLMLLAFGLVLRRRRRR